MTINLCRIKINVWNYYTWDDRGKCNGCDWGTAEYGDIGQLLLQKKKQLAIN